MKKMRKPLAIAAILCVAIATSILATWLSEIVEEEPPGIEAVTSADQDSPTGRAIDWDALPDEVIAWVEVPGTGIDEPIVQAAGRLRHAVYRLRVLDRLALRHGLWAPHVGRLCLRALRELH